MKSRKLSDFAVFLEYLPCEAGDTAWKEHTIVRIHDLWVPNEIIYQQKGQMKSKSKLYTQFICEWD